MKAIRKTRETQANLSRELIKTWTTKMIIYSKDWCVLIIEQEKIPTRETRALNDKKFPIITRHRHIPGSWVFFAVVFLRFSFFFQVMTRWKKKERKTSVCVYVREKKTKTKNNNTHLCKWSTTTGIIIQCKFTRTTCWRLMFHNSYPNPSPTARKQQGHQHYHWWAFSLFLFLQKNKKTKKNRKRKVGGR